MKVGNVLEQTFGLYQRFFLRFVAITAIVMAVIELLNAIVVDARPGGFVVWLVTVVLSLVGGFWVQGALAFAVADVRDGRADSSIGELFGRARPMLGTLIVVGVLAGIGIGIGFLLLILPGLYLISRWAVVVPAVVLEKRGVGEAFARSSELTKGFRLGVLVIVVAVSLGAWLVGGILGLIVDALVPGLVGIWLGGLVTDLIAVPFVAVALTVTYFNLVRVAEPSPGSDPEPGAAPA